MEDFFSYSYYILLLIFLITSFIGRGMGFKKSAVFASIWLSFLALFVIGYAYRFEMLDIKNKLISEIYPSKAIIENNKIILTSSIDGHFYLKALIENKEITFLIDTGASDIVLSKKDASKIGVNLNSLNYNKIYNTANGAVRAASYVLDHIKVDKIIFTDVRVSINKSEMDTSLMGMSFLRRFKNYSFSQNKLVLEI